MDVNAIADALKDFVRAHKTAFSEISARESQLLELAAVVAVHEHYRSNEYTTTVVGAAGGTFVVKTGTRGIRRAIRECASRRMALPQRST